MVTHIYGHRGARGLYPENTLEGFWETLKLPIKGIELDVVVSKDYQLLVSHEPWMHHLFCTSPNGHLITKDREKQHNIYQMTVHQVQQYDCGKRKHPQFPNQITFPAYKPTLNEVFKLFSKKNKQLELFLEIKSNPKWYNTYQPKPNRYAELVNSFLKSNPFTGTIIIKSFDTNFLNAIYRIDPNYTLGLLVKNTNGVEANLKLLNFIPSHYSLFHEYVTSQENEILLANKIELIPWTVNTIENAQQLSDIGITKIITDYPNRFIRVDGY
ncbi:MAG: glycerophosphodiester phosphodiesterase [Flavobacteriales bacterium]|nr:MAG: glycerophosphodiester phosphodiesterase [Flavobacteriales bacterium]